MVATFQILDLTSDVFVALRLWTLRDLKDVYMALFVASFVCLATPLLVSWCQLIREVRNYWWNDDVGVLSLSKHSISQ